MPKSIPPKANILMLKYREKIPPTNARTFFTIFGTKKFITETISGIRITKTK
jgi:hypothetical protein